MLGRGKNPISSIYWLLSRARRSPVKSYCSVISKQIDKPLLPLDKYLFQVVNGFLVIFIQEITQLLKTRKDAEKIAIMVNKRIKAAPKSGRAASLVTGKSRPG